MSHLLAALDRPECIEENPLTATASSSPSYKIALDTDKPISSARFDVIFQHSGLARHRPGLLIERIDCLALDRLVRLCLVILGAATEAVPQDANQNGGGAEHGKEGPQTWVADQVSDVDEDKGSCNSMIAGLATYYRGAFAAGKTKGVTMPERLAIATLLVSHETIFITCMDSHATHGNPG